MSGDVAIRRPEQDQATLTLVARSVELANQAQRLAVIETGEQANAAAALVVEATRVEKALEKARTDITGPINNLLRAFNQHYKSATEPLARVRTALGRRIAEYRTAEQRRAEAEAAAARAAAAEAARLEAERAAASVQPSADLLDDAGDVLGLGDPALERVEIAEVAVEMATKPLRVEGGGTVSMRKVRTFRIVDAALIPREWMAPNERAIGAAVRGGIAAIPGIEITETETAVVRT